MYCYCVHTDYDTVTYPVLYCTVCTYTYLKANSLIDSFAIHCKNAQVQSAPMQIVRPCESESLSERCACPAALLWQATSALSSLAIRARRPSPLPRRLKQLHRDCRWPPFRRRAACHSKVGRCGPCGPSSWQCQCLWHSMSVPVRACGRCPPGRGQTD